MSDINKSEIEKHYIKIPRKIVEEAIKHNEKLLVYIYMYLHKSMFNSVNFSINSIMKFYHITPRHVDAIKIYEEVVYIIKDCRTDAYPIAINSSKTLKNNVLYTIVFNKEYFETNDSFAMIEINELFDIINFKSNVSIKRQLLFLSFYRINMNRRDRRMHDSIEYKPEIWFFYAKKLCKRLSMCESTCRKVIVALEEIKIIKTKRLANYKLTDNADSNDWRSGYLLIADYRPFFNSKYSYEDELAYGIPYVMKIVNEYKNKINKKENLNN